MPSGGAGRGLRSPRSAPLRGPFAPEKALENGLFPALSAGPLLWGAQPPAATPAREIEEPANLGYLSGAIAESVQDDERRNQRGERIEEKEVTTSPSTEAPVRGPRWLHKRASAEGAKKTVFQGFSGLSGWFQGRSAGV